MRKFRYEAECGMLGVNIGVAAPMSFFPFTGWKESFFGDLHAHGRDAIDFFTEKINGRARASRTDYFPSENDNITVQGVRGERGGLGYFGLSYYEENIGKLNLLKVDGGNGCVAPNKKTVQSKRYKPLSRPLFIYVKKTSFKRAAVHAFIGYILKNERAIARKAKFVPLTDAQLDLARDKFKGRRR